MAPSILREGAFAPPPVISLVVFIVFGYILWTVIYNLFLSPLSKFPGPKLAAIYYGPTIYWTFKGVNHIKMKELHEKYGDVVRMGPSILVYRSPQAWKDIYGHRKTGAGSFLKDPTFYIKNPFGGNILNADDADHSRTRRLLSHAFSEKALREQEDLIQSYVDLLVDGLNKQISKSQDAVDMVRWYNYTTFDIIGDLAFGEPFYCLKDNKYLPWVSMVFASAKGVALMRPLGIYPSLAPIVKRFLPKKVMENRLKHYQMSEAKLLRRIETETERPDFMTYVTRHNDDRSLSVQEMKANAGLLIIAGSETTASLLSGFTYYLLQNKTAYQKLREELRGTFGSYDEINFKAVVGLPYLNASLEEALRMYPPLPATLPRVVPKGGSVIDGEYFPEGVSVGGAHYSTYHAESYFTNAESYIPERWLEDREARYESDDRAALSVFSLEKDKFDLNFVVTRWYYNTDIKNR
ncbi:Cytochrome monooxygenase lcsI [Penicillium angulare]|uniref:Cytochrome monooxygenase lcsI n=1 Tax=Penicillium angulare TaxID=116970 RepID=A0A9W9FXB6_9EURO|nr:Cytochrome monooxygenase lcsI [Penicillium angulare]